MQDPLISRYEAVGGGSINKQRVESVQSINQLPVETIEDHSSATRLSCRNLPVLML